MFSKLVGIFPPSSFYFNSFLSRFMAFVSFVISLSFSSNNSWYSKIKNYCTAFFNLSNKTTFFSIFYIQITFLSLHFHLLIFYLSDFFKKKTNLYQCEFRLNFFILIKKVADFDHVLISFNNFIYFLTK